jgi:hypothetical protein
MVLEARPEADPQDPYQEAVGYLGPRREGGHLGHLGP